MSYGGESQFEPPTPAQKAQSQAARNAQIQAARAAQLSAQEAAARQQQIQSAPATATRQQAPGAVSSGSPQDIALRAEAAKEEQQAMVQANVHQIASSGGEFATQREQALQRGKFDVSTVSYAFKGTPATYVTPLGQTVTRQGGGITGGGSTPTGAPIDISASQLAKTDALRASMGLPPLEQIAQTQVVKGTQSLPVQMAQVTKPSGSAPIDISTAQLARTDQLRSMMGLPPLEQVAKTQTVKGTAPSVTITPKTASPLDYRHELAAALATGQGALQAAQPSEVASFLKVPFVGQKVSTPLIPSTSLADVGQFVPFGIGLGEKALAAGKTLSGIFLKEFTPTGEKAAVKGGADIGLNVPKYTEQFKTEQNLQNLIREKQVPLLSSTTAKTSERISLGRGLAREVSKGKGGGASTGTRPSGGPPPEKTVPAGRGLEQLVRQKEVTKTTRQKPSFEQQQAAKQEKFLRDQEQKTKLEETTKVKQEEPLLQRTGFRYVTTPKPKEKQTTAPLIVVPKPKPKQTTTTPNLIFVPPPSKPTQPQIPKTTPIPKHKPITTPVTLLIPTPTFTPPPTSPPTQTPPPPPPLVPPPGEPPTGKRLPPDLFGSLGGSLTGGGGRGPAFGAKKSFIGNVPTSSIIGVYKRGEISYGESAMRSSSKETSMLSRGKFTTKKKGRIL